MHQYTIQVPAHRDEWAMHLRDRGIGTLTSIGFLVRPLRGRVEEGNQGIPAPQAGSP